MRLSKFLSYICRHGAEKKGLQLHSGETQHLPALPHPLHPNCDAGGFVSVPATLRLCQGFNEDDVRRVVANCPKQRFALREDAETGELQIRANQGHTMKVRNRC